MLKFYELLIIGEIFCGFYIGLFLLLRSKYQLHANRLLSITMLSWSWYHIFYILMVVDLLKNFPHLLRVATPIYYLATASVYLYVRSILNDETKFRRWDWLHAIPAILCFIELIPFYFASTAYKIELANIMTSDYKKMYYLGGGYLPAITHYILRPVLGIIYSGFAYLEILSFRNNISKSITVKNWLLSFISFNFFMYTGALLYFLTAEKNVVYNHEVLLRQDFSNGAFSDTAFLSQTLVGLTFIFLMAYLLFNPEVLYGIPRFNFNFIQVRQEGTELENQRELIANKELINVYVSKIEEHVIDNKLFQQQGITIKNLAKNINIPLHHLSFIINRYYKLRFTDFINMYRVDYIKKRLKEDDWRLLTLEGLAYEAGFSSRSTFFSAFKKITGVSPTKYIEDVIE